MFQLYRNFATQAQIDAEYDVGAMVTGAAAYRTRYSDKSDQARRELDCVLDVAFGPTLDETLDIFPAARRGAPVFVFMHGGYWRAFSSKDFSFVALGLQRLGITTVVVNYSLAPKVSLDEITRQACASIAWVIRNIGQHGGDPQRIVVGGHSAGAQLSAMCMRAEWQREYGLTADSIVGAVLVSGIYDLTPLRYSYLQPMIQLDDGVIRRNSPLFLMRQARARSLVCWGSEESGEFKRQSRAFHDALRAGGNHSELTSLSGANHFTAISGFEQSDSFLCRWIAAAADGTTTPIEPGSP